MDYKTNLPHKGILEALESMRPTEITEGRATDLNQVRDDLDEAEEAMRLAIRHLENAAAFAPNDSNIAGQIKSYTIGTLDNFIDSPYQMGSIEKIREALAEYEDEQRMMQADEDED